MYTGTGRLTARNCVLVQIYRRVHHNVKLLVPDGVFLVGLGAGLENGASAERQGVSVHSLEAWRSSGVPTQTTTHLDLPPLAQLQQDERVHAVEHAALEARAAHHLCIRVGSAAIESVWWWLQTRPTPCTSCLDVQHAHGGRGQAKVGHEGQRKLVGVHQHLARNNGDGCKGAGAERA